MLSTKIGRLLRPHEPDATANLRSRNALPFAQAYDYSYDGALRSLEDSLQRLGLGCIDVALIHDIDAYHHGPEEQKRLCLHILTQTGMTSKDFQLGATKCFMKQAVVSVLEEVRQRLSLGAATRLQAAQRRRYQRHVYVELRFRAVRLQAWSRRKRGPGGE